MPGADTRPLAQDVAMVLATAADNAKIANENRVGSRAESRGFIFSSLSLGNFVGPRDRSIRPSGLFSLERRTTRV